MDALMQAVYGSHSTLSHHFWRLPSAASAREVWFTKNNANFGERVRFELAKLQNPPRGLIKPADLQRNVWAQLELYEKEKGEKLI